MPSPDSKSIDLPILTFGGMVTQYDPQALPPGASPFCQDVSFSDVTPSGGGIVGGWASRPGMANFYTVPFAGNPTVNYVKTFIDSMGAIHTLTSDGLGVFRDETPSSTPPIAPSIIGSVIAASIIQSDALFTREFIAIGDGNFGIDIPRQWDGAYFDRVSQIGPGGPPTAADGAAGNVNAGIHQIAVAFITREQYITKPSIWINYTAPGAKKINLTNIPTGPPNIIARVILVTPVITAPAITGDFFFFDGAVPTPTAGTFPSMVIQDNTTTSYTVDWIDAVLENTPIATNLFNLLELGECAQFTAYSNRLFGAGERNKLSNLVNQTFDGGFASVPAGNSSGPNSPTSGTDGGSIGGGGNALWTNPGNILALDGVLATAITNNTTLDSTDYLNAEGYGFAVPLGATISGIVVTVYCKASALSIVNAFRVYGLKAGSRVGANRATGLTIGTTIAPQVFGGPSDLWGTTWTPADINNSNFGVAVAFAANSNANITTSVDFISIQVYFSTGGAGSSPLGWTQGAAFLGGNSALSLGLPTYWGDAYAIKGDGVTAKRGEINQSAFQDFFGNPIIQQNISYRVRVRLAQDGTLVAGTAHINLQSTTGAFTTIGLAIPAASVTTSYTEFQAYLTDVPLLTVPADLLLQVFADGTPNNLGTFLVETIEIYPVNLPFNRTLIRVSYANDPESFDQLTGLLSVDAGNGENVKLTFNILDNKLYIVKDRSMFVTQDDGQNEPDLWTINTVSDTVGTPSNRGVGIGESWAVIAARQGAYIFWGSEPVKISQEIQPTWDRINWLYGDTIYVVVDTIKKRIHIGAPLDTATSPSVEFVCDYSQLANSEGATSAQDIASHPQAYYSVYQPTKLTAPGKARKWTIWNISMNCASLTVRSDGSFHLLRGNGTGTGKVYDQLPGQLSDDGVAINTMYQTYLFPQAEDEQVLQLGAHRKLCKYLTGYAYGVGTLNTFIQGAQNQRQVMLSSRTLKNPDKWDWEQNVNFNAERMSLLFGINAVGSWVHMTKLCPTIQRELVTPVRGTA